LSLGFTVVVIVPFSLDEAQVVILNRTVPPGCTLLSEDLTTRKGFVGDGGGVVGGGDDGGGDDGGGVVEVLPPLPEPDGCLVIVGVGVADAFGDELADANGFAVVDKLDGLAVAEELAELDGFAVADEVAELDGFAVVAELDGLAVAEELAELDGFAVVDGVAVGVGGTAKAVPVMPLESTKRPVAKPSVTGRVYADDMRTPCLWWLSRLGNVLFGIVGHIGYIGCVLVTDVPIRH
jgi:hypothetical protein